jgi:hypothetical protein
VAGEMLENAIEIVAQFGRNLDSRHDQRASFLAFGRSAFFPESRFSR